MSLIGNLRDAISGRVPGVTAATIAAVQGGQRAQVTTGGGASFFTGTIDLSAGGRDPLGDPVTWRRNVAATRCVQTIAGNLAALDLAAVGADGEAIDGHPVAVLWNDTASGGWSARTRREVMFARAELKGEAFAYLERAGGPGSTGPVVGVWPILDTVDVVVDGDRSDPRGQQLAGFLVKRPKVKPIALLPDEVLWLRYPDPESQWGALAPWRSAVDAAGLDQAASAWQTGELRNGARPAHVVYLGELASDEEYLRGKAEWNAFVRGPDAAGGAFLTSGATAPTVSRLTLTPAEMSYLESRTRNAEDVMLAFGMRPDYFNGGATYENQRAAKVALWSDVLLPKLDVLGSEVDRQMIPEPEVTAGWDVSDVEALHENVDALWTRVQTATTADLATLDEARAMIGLDPLPGGIGGVTISAYRAQYGPTSAAAAVAPPARSAAAPVRRRTVAVRGVVRTAAPVTRRTPRRLGRPRILAFYDAHERIGERVVTALAERQLKVVLRNLNKLRTSQLDTMRQRWEAGRDDALYGLNLAGDGVSLVVRVGADEVFDAAYWFEQTRQDSEAWLRGVWEGGGVQTAAGIGIDFDHFDRGVLAAMDERRTVLAQQVTATTRQVLDSALLDAAAEQGWSIDDMASAVRDVFGILSDSRARTIARTEVVGGFNRSSYMVARDSGVVLSRTWLAAHDPRVRDSHRALDGTTVQLEAPYPNGLMHPGDPDGPADETINCRCVETYDVGD